MGKRLAIIVAFNDVSTFHGGSRVGVKSEISYFDQFVMLVRSMRENWLEENFEYYVVAVHSVPFDQRKKAILDSLGVVLVQADYNIYKLKVRPAAYLIDLECDFRLILDVDTLAFKMPIFDFSKDVQATYGGNKYNIKQWTEVCNFLGCVLPKNTCLKRKAGGYRSWGFREHYLHQRGLLSGRIFPYFNNGAVLVKNSVAPTLGDTWNLFRLKYTEFILCNEGIDIDLEGQDVLGLAINNTTDNWGALPTGFNYILQEKFILGRRLLISKHIKNLSLIHYINTPSSCSWGQFILSYYYSTREIYHTNF